MSTNMKKKGFGLVSKIGSLIKKNSNNIDNAETSGRSDDQNRKFHIQLSEGNEEDLVDINNMNEEEEEEEEEEENDKKLTKKTTTETHVNNINESKKKENTNNKINNNENNTENSTEKNYKNENDISTNKNCINLNNNETKKNFEIPDEDLVCHTLLKKGNDFFPDDYKIFPIIKNKKKKTMFTLFKKQQKTENVNYIMFFDDQLMYFSKDAICDKKETTKRRICNYVSLYNIIKIANVRDDNDKNMFIVNLDIQKNNGIKKTKKFTIDEKYFKDFMEILNNKLKIYNIILNQ